MPANWVIIAVIVAAALVATAYFARWLLDNPRDDFEAGMLWHGVRIYSRIMHGLTIRGKENLPGAKNPGPLILVINHSSGVDPVLVQAACPFEIRWVMAADMRHPLGEPLWRWSRVIFVERMPRPDRDVGGAREAVRHLREGGVLGIFPEGAIERPPGRLLPFHPGVGFIIRRTGAPVLPVIVEGTPSGGAVWSSLWRTSRARVTFCPMLDYRNGPRSPEEIAEDLRSRFAEWTGWPIADDPAVADVDADDERPPD